MPLVLLCLVCSPLTAAAPALPSAAPVAAEGGGSALLARGLAAYAELDFRQARRLLEAALDAGELPLSDRIAALAHLARTLAVLRLPRGAERRFLELLVLDPEHRVGWEESPHIRSAFAAARRQRERQAKQLAAVFALPPEATGMAPPAAAAASTAAEEPTRLTQWLVVGGAVAVAGAILATLLVTSQGDDSEDDIVYRWKLP